MISVSSALFMILGLTIRVLSGRFCIFIFLMIMRLDYPKYTGNHLEPHIECLELSPLECHSFDTLKNVILST